MYEIMIALQTPCRARSNVVRFASNVAGKAISTYKGTNVTWTDTRLNPVPLWISGLQHAWPQLEGDRVGILTQGH